VQAEQRIRAERLQALGMATVVWRDELTPARMAKALTARPPRPRAMPGQTFDGARLAADHIAAILTDAAQSPAEVTANG
jgi:predicted glycosyltransferase